MSYVDEAFQKLKANLEITRTESKFASSKHNEIRDHVRAKWTLSDDFLTGSYRRDTKTKRLKDVDIFVVAASDGPQGSLRKQPPGTILSELQRLLSEHYKELTVDGFACTIHFGTDEEVGSFDVVPAVERQGGGWEIPDAGRGRWISTNPKLHHEDSTAKNEACDGNYVPFVKMIKAINREADEPIQPPFLLEVMALEIVDEPFGRFQDEIVWFLATAADRVREDWADPASIGPDVNGDWTQAQRRDAETAVSEWQKIAEEAVRLEDDESERAAVEEWRRLFGWRMPRP